MGSTAVARPGAPAVERAARAVLNAGLGRGDSAFSPGTAIWTPAAADELDRFYVQRIDTGAGTFLQKLETQLDGASPEAVQLCAELLYLNALPLANVNAATIRNRIKTVLSWLPEPVAIPPDLDAALEQGIFSGGVGFSTMLWSQLVYLVAMVQSWWELSPEDREVTLGDPWRWRDFLADVPGGNAPSQRNSLKYLAFPEVFQPIVNKQHRTAIIKEYQHLLPQGERDVDKDLLTIFRALEATSPDELVDFYEPQWDSWRKPAPVAGRRAWLVRPPAGMEPAVGDWLSEGFLSLPVSRLRDLPTKPTLAEVRTAVAEDYSTLDYVGQQDLANSVNVLLGVMEQNDLVLVIDGTDVEIGLASGAATTRVGHDLRRDVEWRTDGDVSLDELPPSVHRHMAVQGTFLDLSEDLDKLVALLAGEPAASSGVDVPSRTDQPKLVPATQELASSLNIDKGFLQEWIDLLEDKQQVIFFGPPGTGKTFVAERLARFLAESADLESDRVALVQFHPSTSYEDFVEGYRPGLPNAEGQLQFELTPGPLTRMAAAARRDPSKPFFLIIDEINRANLAKVFGELYYLLEYRDRGIRLLYRPGQPFSLPSNLFFIGTMNTADRSIALVDAAMRRRFAFVELHPDDEPVSGLLRRWLQRKSGSEERADLLMALNKRIEDRDFKIGPSYLMKREAERSGGLDRVWRYSILPLLVEHHHGRLTPGQVEDKYGLTALRVALSQEAST